MSDYLPRKYMTWDGVRYRRVYQGDPGSFDFWAQGFDSLDELVPAEFEWEGDWERITRGLPFSSDPADFCNYTGYAVLRSLKVEQVEFAKEYGNAPGCAGVTFEVWIPLSDIPTAKKAIAELKARFAEWREAQEQTASL